jgi:cobyrinic acid a,c-diamide synthase
VVQEGFIHQGNLTLRRQMVRRLACEVTRVYVECGGLLLLVEVLALHFRDLLF